MIAAPASTAASPAPRQGSATAGRGGRAAPSGSRRKGPWRALLLLGALAVAGCGEAPVPAIVGRYGVRIDPAVGKSPEEANALSGLRATVCELRADGTFEMTMPITNEVNSGTWSFAEERLALTARKADGSHGTLAGPVTGETITLENVTGDVTMRLFLRRIAGR